MQWSIRGGLLQGCTATGQFQHVSFKCGCSMFLEQAVCPFTLCFPLSQHNDLQRRCFLHSPVRTRLCVWHLNWQNNRQSPNCTVIALFLRIRSLQGAYLAKHLKGSLFMGLRNPQELFGPSLPGRWLCLGHETLAQSKLVSYLWFFNTTSFWLDPRKPDETK